MHLGRVPRARGHLRPTLEAQQAAFDQWWRSSITYASAKRSECVRLRSLYVAPATCTRTASTRSGSSASLRAPPRVAPARAPPRRSRRAGSRRSNGSSGSVTSFSEATCTDGTTKCPRWSRATRRERYFPDPGTRAATSLRRRPTRPRRTLRDRILVRAGAAAGATVTRRPRLWRRHALFFACEAQTERRPAPRRRGE